jgi:hypothetical protein
MKGEGKLFGKRKGTRGKATIENNGGGDDQSTLYTCMKTL